MIQECKNYELEEPELMDYDGDFRVNLYRKELLTDGNPLELTTSAGTVRKNAETHRRVLEQCRKMPETHQRVLEQCRKMPETHQRVPEQCRKVPEAYQRVPGECRNTVERFRVMPESNYLNYMRKEQHRIIMDHIKINGYITSSQTETLLHIKQRRARDILSRMTREGLLERRGSGKNTVYYPAS